jgi:hypothetical protein
MFRKDVVSVSLAASAGASRSEEDVGSCWHPDMADIAARSWKDLMQKLRMRTPDGESV